ncbi:MAG: hypothetical protein UHN88_06805, partial [Eubacterium sp.]|nr:hypothetical protein [Eubacterium sp.]
FNFTMLTVDTHFEDGYVCDICPDTFGDNQYANVMACSSKQIYDLIEWIKQQDFYDNTTIVISGDHPTMDSDFCNDVPEDYQRRVYTAYINPAAEIADPTRERQFSTFDQFPTTLAAMGVQINGDRLGLGTNLFSDVDTLTEKYGYEKNYDELSAKSLYMQSIADLSLDNEALSALRDSSVSGKMTTTMTSEQAHSYYFRFSDLTCSAVNKIRPSIVKVWTGDTEEDEENAVTFTSSESTDGSFHHLLLTREMLIAAGIQDPSVVHVKGYAVDVNGLEYEIASLTLEFPEPTLANGEPKQEGRFYLMDEFGNVINDDTVPADEEVEADSTDDSDLMPEEKQGLSENPEIFTEMPDSGQ